MILKNEKTFCFEVYEKTPLLEEQDKALTLIHKDEPQTRIKVRVKDGFAVAEVKLQPCKEDTDNEDWEQKLDPDQRALNTAELYIKAVATENTFTVRSSGEFLKEEPFELRKAIHFYEVNVSKFSFIKKTKLDKKFKKYRYAIVKSNNNKDYFDLTMNEHGLLDFPESGGNWGRYGSRDTGGDNWIDEEAAAAFFGFLYSLAADGVQETLYYNDISANDKRNIGHKTHRTGKDIDIRYPGTDNSAGGKDWSISKAHYGTEKKFVEKLESILEKATKWNFTKKHNYAYKKDIKHTSGKATSVHQDHFHIGYQR